MSEKLTIGLLQRKCSTDAAANLAGTIEAIREAAKRGAQIICLEELFRSQYFCREENAELFRSGRADSRADPPKLSQSSPRN